MSEHLPAATAGAAAADTVPLPGADVTPLPLTAAPETPAGPPLPEKLVEGYIDAVNGHKVSGWAWCRSAPLFAVEVEIRIGDRVAAVVRADLLRPDLAKAGLGDGRHGFSVVLDDPVADDARGSVSAFVRCGPNGGKAALINRSIRPAAPVPPAAPVEATSLPMPSAPAITEKQLERLGKRLEAGIAAVVNGAAKESRQLAVELRGLRDDILRTAGVDDLRAVQEEVAGLSARTELLQLRLDEVLAAVAGDAAVRPPAGAREKGLIFVVAILAVISLSALVLGLIAVLL